MRQYCCLPSSTERPNARIPNVPNVWDALLFHNLEHRQRTAYGVRLKVRMIPNETQVQCKSVEQGKADTNIAGIKGRQP